MSNKSLSYLTSKSVATKPGTLAVCCKPSSGGRCCMDGNNPWGAGLDSGPWRMTTARSRVRTPWMTKFFQAILLYETRDNDVISIYMCLFSLGWVFNHCNVADFSDCLSIVLSLQKYNPSVGSYIKKHMLLHRGVAQYKCLNANRLTVTHCY